MQFIVAECLFDLYELLTAGSHFTRGRRHHANLLRRGVDSLVLPCQHVGTRELLTVDTRDYRQFGNRHLHS